MMVWPVSSLVLTVRVGSSSTRRPSDFAHLFAIALGLRLDGHGDDRLGEGRRLELDVEILDAKRVARLDVLDADDGGDVARVNRFDFLALVGLDLDDAADAVALVGARIVDRGALGQLAGIDAEEDELADEGIGPELERERTELARCRRRGPGLFPRGCAG